MQMPKTMIGIYCIENVINGKKYIGCSTNIEYRWKNHKRELKKRMHANDHLQKAYDKYSEENFKYYVIEECPEEELFEKEVQYIELYQTKDGNFGYNLSAGGQGTLHPREETREKLRNRPHTEESRRKRSEATKGRPKPEEWKARMRLKKLTEEHKRAMFLGRDNWIETEEQKENRSSKMRNKKSINKNPSSKYVGVSADGAWWRALIRYDKKQIYLGVFQTELDAAIKYNEAFSFYYPEEYPPILSQMRKVNVQSY